MVYSDEWFKNTIIFFNEIEFYLIYNFNNYISKELSSPFGIFFFNPLGFVAFKS